MDISSCDRLPVHKIAHDDYVHVPEFLRWIDRR